jgi:hypothetical protein
MKVIELTKGYEAYIDDADAEAAASHKWYASEANGGAQVYAVTNQRGGAGRLYLHHLVMGKPDRGFVVDHINGDTLDNRRTNLRFATLSENVQNNHSRVKSKAGYRGVQLQQGRYVARIARNKVRIYLGIYSTAEQAAAAIQAYEAANPADPSDPVPSLVARIAELEEETQRLRRELAELEAQEAAA